MDGPRQGEARPLADRLGERVDENAGAKPANGRQAVCRFAADCFPERRSVSIS